MPEKEGTVCRVCHAVSGHTDAQGRPEKHTVADNGEPCPKRGQVA